MFVPLGTDRPLRRPTLITPVLIAANIAVFLGQLVFARADPAAYQRALGQLWVHGHDFHWWTLITSAFLHADSHFWHILGNMLFLWVFGPNIEDRLGRVGFSIFYFCAAAASSGAHALLDDNPAIGASGAIAGCTGAYLVLFPRTHVKVLSLLFILGFFNVPAWWFIGLKVMWDVLLQGSGANTGVAHAAHLGGAFFGIAVALALLWLRLVPREPYDLFTIGRQAYRRRQFKEAGLQAELAARQRLVRANNHGPDDSDALAAARADVVRLLTAGDMPAAATAYRALADRFGDRPGATALARRHQYDLANHLYAAAKYQDAAYAYERFLDEYPKDPEAPEIRLMLGRIMARQLNDPIRAKALLSEAAAQLDADDARAIAERELKALG